MKHKNKNPYHYLTLIVFWVATLIFLCPLRAVAQVSSTAKETPYSTNTLLVQTKENVEKTLFEAEIKRDFQKFNLKASVLYPALHLYKVTFEGIEATIVKQILEKKATIASVQYNYRADFRATTPNDSLYTAKQWNMDLIGMPTAWDATTGGLTATGDTIVIAVLDNEFDLKHNDLSQNIWRNGGEIPNDDLDNDGNGYKDDVYGYNFLLKSGINHNNLGAHGTGVAGIIGAKGNNTKGLTGINWNVKIMALSFDGDADKAIAAIKYATDMRLAYEQSNGKKGAFVVAINGSFGFDYGFPKDFPVLCEVIDAAGKAGILSTWATSNSDIDIDEQGDMPALCTSQYSIVVNNNDENDAFFSSGRSKTSVDLAAPGQNTYSLRKENKYSLFGGTSGATPHVAGAIGLLYSLPYPALARAAHNSPSETALKLKELMLKGVKQIATFADKNTSGGRLDVANTFTLTKEAFFTTQPLEIIKIGPNPVQTEFSVTYTTPDLDSYTARIINTAGQVVAEKNVQPERTRTSPHLTWNVENLPNGVYFLQLLSADNRVVVRKFVVLR
jgi:subtilisin family serine protease